MNISLITGVLFVIEANWFSKQLAGFFCIVLCPYLIACYRHENGQYSLDFWLGCHRMHPNSQQKNTISNFQSEQTHGILQGVINGTGRKQAQNKFNK